MDEFMKEALEIAKAQAGVRPMTAEEFMAYVKEIAQGLLGVAVTKELDDYFESHPFPVEDAKKSIKERSVTCLVCGKSFKVLGKKHLALHGLTPNTYREKFGLKKGTPLICKALVKERRAKMKDMKLWERSAEKRSTIPMDALADMSDE